MDRTHRAGAGTGLPESLKETVTIPVLKSPSTWSRPHQGQRDGSGWGLGGQAGLGGGAQEAAEVSVWGPQLRAGRSGQHELRPPSFSGPLRSCKEVPAAGTGVITFPGNPACKAGGGGGAAPPGSSWGGPSGEMLKTNGTQRKGGHVPTPAPPLRLLSGLKGSCSPRPPAPKVLEAPRVGRTLPPDLVTKH